MRALISFFNNLNYFKSQETFYVLRLDFSEIQLFICIKIFVEKIWKNEEKRRHFQDDL